MQVVINKYIQNNNIGKLFMFNIYIKMEYLYQKDILKMNIHII